MRLTERDAWRDYAACLDLPTRAFFEDIWPESGGMDQEALAAARGVCRGCPVRVACHTAAMAEEAGQAVVLRHGLRAMLTPEQRHSLERRRWKCGCGAVLDPADLIVGRRRCPRACTSESRTAPLEDMGDKWTRRHTVAARKMLAYLENVFTPGDIIPRVQVMADHLGIRRNDLDRVYSALVFDGVLEKVGRDYRLRGHLAARSACYVPGHLR